LRLRSARSRVWRGAVADFAARDRRCRSVIVLQPLASIDPAAVESLLDRAFGSDRHARTAYKVRGRAQAITALSFAAVDDGVLIGSIQCWPIALDMDDGPVVPLVMVGPVAVAPDRQRDGIGRRLMARTLAAADEGAADTGAGLMLIGDPEYYGRFFGFSAQRTSAWRLPGPVERRRLLARGATVPDAPGRLGPR
jgi:predicted N-acetyltransferase YhbS